MSADHTQDLTGNLFALLNAHQAAGERPSDAQLDEIAYQSGAAVVAVLQAFNAAARASKAVAH